MKSRYLIIPLLLASVVALGAGSVAYAEQGSTSGTITLTTDGSGTKVEEKARKEFDLLMKKRAPSIMIGMGGRADLDAAKVTAISGSTLTVSLFGHTFTVKTEGAKTNNGAWSATPTVGSRVWIKGKIDETTGVITATEVRSFTTEKPKMSGNATTTATVNASTTMKTDRPMLENAQMKIKELMEKIKKLQGEKK
ncbi:MAG: hypothetical protein AB199_03775 [Parcubacteria bacterium C7867-004]|nr:MAG: hypothetical protein AB199_03775 [Parcubacteria bacterium C7867-004]